MGRDERCLVSVLRYADGNGLGMSWGRFAASGMVDAICQGTRKFLILCEGK